MEIMEIMMAIQHFCSSFHSYPFDFIQVNGINSYDNAECNDQSQCEWLQSGNSVMIVTGMIVTLYEVFHEYLCKIFLRRSFNGMIKNTKFYQELIWLFMVYHGAHTLKFG